MNTSIEPTEKQNTAIQTASNQNYYTKQLLSNSLLKKALVSLEKFKYEWDHVTEENPETPSMLFGNLCHTLLLEPQEFGKRYAINKYNPRTNDAKNFKEAANKAGIKVISASDFDRAKTMIDGLVSSQYAHPDLVSKVKFLLSLDLEIEKEIYWTDEQTGLPCKAKLDGYNREHNIIVDYKTIESLSDYKIDRNFSDYRYDIATGHYSEAIKAEYKDEKFPSFLFIVQEKDEPFSFRILIPDNDMLTIGLNTRARIMSELKTAFAEDSFHSYKGIETIAIPSWLKK